MTTLAYSCWIFYMVESHHIVGFQSFPCKEHTGDTRHTAAMLVGISRDRLQINQDGGHDIMRKPPIYQSSFVT